MTGTRHLEDDRLCSHCGTVVKVNRYGCFRLHFVTEPNGQSQLCQTSGRLPEEVRS